MSPINGPTKISEDSKTLSNLKRKVVASKSAKNSGIGSKPKRPLSVYNFFFQVERQKLLRELPSRPEGKPRRSHGKCGFDTMAKIIAKKWKIREVDSADMELFKAKAQQDMLRYQRELEVYNKKVLDAVKKSFPSKDNTPVNAVSVVSNAEDDDEEENEVIQSSPISKIYQGNPTGLEPVVEISREDDTMSRNWEETSTSTSHRAGCAGYNKNNVVTTIHNPFMANSDENVASAFRDDRQHQPKETFFEATFDMASINTSLAHSSVESLGAWASPAVASCNSRIALDSPFYPTPIRSHFLPHQDNSRSWCGPTINNAFFVTNNTDGSSRHASRNMENLAYALGEEGVDYFIELFSSRNDFLNFTVT